MQYAHSLVKSVPQGKSMSLICGSLKWLEDHKQRQESRMQQIVSAPECHRYMNVCEELTITTMLNVYLLMFC